MAIVAALALAALTVGVGAVLVRLLLRAPLRRRRHAGHALSDKDFAHGKQLGGIRVVAPAHHHGQAIQVRLQALAMLRQRDSELCHVHIDQQKGQRLSGLACIHLLEDGLVEVAVGASHDALFVPHLWVEKGVEKGGSHVRGGGR